MSEQGRLIVVLWQLVEPSPGSVQAQGKGGHEHGRHAAQQVRVVQKLRDLERLGLRREDRRQTFPLNSSDYILVTPAAYGRQPLP